MVDLDRVRDRIPLGLSNVLANDPSGIVLDYKMTDGTGVGVVLELSDSSISWFFINEVVVINNEDLRLKSPDIDELDPSAVVPSRNFLSPNNQSYYVSKGEIPPQIDSIYHLFNPFIFSKWLIYSLKDVF